MTQYFESGTMPAEFGEFLQRSAVSLTVADFNRPDCPLVGVNQPFCDLSGYAPHEILGHNCRFLQPDGGAGPVRARMRRFLIDNDRTDEKFLIPNLTKDGRRFLNLVYMAKLTRDGRTQLVLGSQFGVSLVGEGRAALYDKALSQDLRQLNQLISKYNWTILGGFDSLASSQAIIAQARLTSTGAG